MTARGSIALLIAVSLCLACANADMLMPIKSPGIISVVDHVIKAQGGGAPPSGLSTDCVVRLEFTNASCAVGNYIDTSGWGHGATQSSAGLRPSFSSPPFLVFDGSDDYLSLTNHVSDLSALTNGTISMWLSKSNNAAQQSAWAMSSGVSSYAGYRVQFLNDNTINYYYYDGSAIRIDARKSGALTNGSWALVSFTVGPKGNSVFVNGVSQAMTYAAGSATSTLFLADFVNPKTFVIGYNIIGAHPLYSFPLKATVGEFRIYNTPQYQDALQADFEAQKSRYGF